MAAPRKDNVKDIILDATKKLLEKKSLSDISLAEIATAAGISKGTLYYHYKNKTDILFDITDRYLGEQWNDFISWTDNKEKDTSIHRLVKYVMERNTASAGIRVHLLNAAMLGDEVMRQKLLKRYKEFGELISQKIAERTQVVPPDYFTWLLLVASDGIIIQEALRNSDFNMQTFITQSADYIQLLEDYKKE